jgi:hypothetical protein
MAEILAAIRAPRRPRKGANASAVMATINALRDAPAMASAIGYAATAQPLRPRRFAS